MPKRQQSSSSSSEQQSSESQAVKYISVYVTKLTPNVTQQHLRQIFSHFGSVKSISVTKGTKLLTSAILQFDKKQEADFAIQYMNNGYIDGSKIAVQYEEQAKKTQKLPERKKTPQKASRKQYVQKQKRIVKHQGRDREREKQRDRRNRQRHNKQRKNRRRESSSSSSSSAVSSSGSDSSDSESSRS